MKAITKRFLYLLITAVLCIVTVFCGQVTLSASADTGADSVQATYESTNVLNNLKGATIGGKEFDLADYPHNSNGKPQIISFVEFCYSYYAEKQADYGLYVYVYNPQDIAFDMSTERNKIQLTYGGKTSYSKYTLEFLNYSTEAGYEGRFWKFKIKLTDEQCAAILKEVDEAERVYKISGIELSVKNKVTEYACGQTYTYKGYALGYGSELAASDTLSCKVDGFDKYLSLDVRSTYYRPKGSNGSENKQDTLHSVYFSVPDAIIAEYGEMTAAHATWLNAYTAPVFVTGNKDFYDNFLPLVGQENPTTDYAFHTNGQGRYWGGFYFVKYSHGYNYSGTENDLSKLNYCFYAENGDADRYTLSAEALVGDSQSGKKGWFETYTAKHGGEKIIDKYSKALFEKYDDKFTDVTITEKDSFKLTSVTSSQNLWQKIWGTSTSYTNTYNMRAIQKVTQDDIDNALSASAFCDEFYVAEADYDDLRDYVKKAKAKKETVYLFRYKQSEYFAVELVQGKYKTGLHTEMIGDKNQLVYGRYFTDTNTNAYLMQQWVQLDFDIIDLTFTKNGVDTVIPVIMSPMDIAADGTPPLITTKDGLSWWQILLGIIALIVIIWLLVKFAPLIVYGIGKVVALPFKAIGKLLKSGKERRRRRKDAILHNYTLTSEQEKVFYDEFYLQRFNEISKKTNNEKERKKYAKNRATQDIENLRVQRNKLQSMNKKERLQEQKDFEKFLKGSKKAEKRHKRELKKLEKRSEPIPVYFEGDISQEAVESYLDSIDWDNVDWVNIDGNRE